MALGKADTGLIQADRAAYTATDPMLGLAAGAGAMAGQFIDVSMKQMEAKSKKQAKQKNDFANAYTKGLDDNSGFAHDVAKQWLTGQLMSDSEAYAAAGGDITGQNEIITGAQSYSNQLYRGEGRIKAHREFHKGRQTRALNSDTIDEHFQDELGAGNYTIRKNDNGVIEWGVKNPDGYKGEKEDDGYTWFTEENLPLGDEFHDEGGAYTLNIFDTEVNKRVDGYESTSPDFKNKYKKKFTEMKMNYFGLKTLIAQDPEGDGIEGNDFYNQFINGQLSNEYYDGILEQGFSDEDLEKLKANPDALKKFLNGENANGTRDYNNLSNRKDWIIDKFSKYMGEVTTTGYNTKQRSELEKQNRYFMLPGEDGMFMGKGGKAPTADAVKSKRLEVYQDLKFETILGENYDPNNVDFNKLVNKKAEDSPLHQNISATYANHIKSGELDLKIDGDEIIIETTDGGEASFTFTGKSKEDQLKTMEQLKNHLATLGPIDTELEALGTDANQWKFKKGAIFPATAEAQEKINQEKEKNEQQNKIKINQELQGKINEAVKAHGPVMKRMSNPNGEGEVIIFKDGTELTDLQLTNFGATTMDFGGDNIATNIEQ